MTLVSTAWRAAALLCVLQLACSDDPERVHGDAADMAVDLLPADDPDLSLPSGPQTCAEAAASKSYIGCDYWPTVTPNSVISLFDFAVVVANTGLSTATVTVTGPMSTTRTASVPSGALAKIYLPWVPALKREDAFFGGSFPLTASALVPKGAFHLVSSTPVIVYQFSPLEYHGDLPGAGAPGKDWSTCNMDTGGNGCFSFSNDASLLLPASALSGNYRVFGKATAGGSGNFVSITATTDNTEVKLKMSATGAVLTGGGVTAIAKGASGTVTLNAGDVLQLVADNMEPDGDFSGSLVQATHPVQIITGNDCLQNPPTSAACDHIEETVFPAETLGRHYVVSSPTGPQGDTPGHTVRLYGNVDGTTLTLTPPVTGVSTVQLAAGQVIDLGGKDVPIAVDFEISGDHAFAVGSYQLGGSIADKAVKQPKQQGDPSESFAIAVEQYRRHYVFLAPDDYQTSFVDVVAPGGAQLMLDGAPITVAPKALPGSTFTVLRVPLGAGQMGAHVMTGDQPFGIQVIGYGAYTSYQYPGGLDLQSIAPPPPPIM